METKSALELELDGVTCTVKENFALMKIQCNVFENLTDLQKDEKVLQWIDLVEAEKELAGILILNEPCCFGIEAYNKFLSNAAGKDLDLNAPGKISSFQKSQIRAIEINMLMTFVKKLINFSKLIVTGLRGEIVTPFVGLTLATDFRVISPTTYLNLCHVNYGLHPSGALPYLLPKYIGQGKAEQYLLRGGKINAEEAITMGLASAVIDDENFTEECINYAKILFATDRNVVRSTKDLLFNYKKDLYLYFDQEANYLYS